MGRGVSSRARQWGVGIGEVRGAGTLHGAGTKKIPERCNDKMLKCMQMLLQRLLLGVWGRAKWWCVHIMLNRSGAMVSLVTLFDTL